MKQKKFYWKFEPGTWLKDPAVTGLSPFARAAWFDLLCHMFEDNESGIVKGKIETLARLARVTVSEMEAAIIEFETCKTCEARRSRDGTVTLKNRRMYAEAKIRFDTAKRNRKLRRSRKPSGTVTPARRESDAPNVTLQLELNNRAYKRNVTEHVPETSQGEVNGKPINGSDRLGIARVDLDLARTLAARLFKKIPIPRGTPAEQRAVDIDTYHRLSILAASRFSEDWLVDGIEAVLASPSRKTKVAHLQGVLNNKLRDHGTSLKHELRNVRVPTSFAEEVAQMSLEE